ncbi:hypothetical protein PPERSA_06225 [Pseudocohnilembus persalinus]|uniref:PIN domain-like protein n=1 Tax=Pseudocohnilembus persalinus TaxID=266149 RepID=A0A0V0R0F3_PSEPJ|nr:hypothetical protein PPERSA_06225 [Pseudocohnilembus persalinus]|eukprot:KRX08047.1 hypothetical protein PPERSA_06225 [Pseudocohnilembus persalinus]
MIGKKINCEKKKIIPPKTFSDLKPDKNEPDIQRQEIKQKDVYIYVDLNNYLRSLLVYSCIWDFSDLLKQIKKKTQTKFEKKLHFVVDFIKVSQEDKEKYITRSEMDFFSGSVIPVYLNYVLAHLLLKEGYPVIFSEDIDCDDLIANLAFHNNGVIVSQDKDYFRYTGIKNGEKHSFFQGAKQPYRTVEKFHLSVFNIKDRTYIDERIQRIWLNKQPFMQKKLILSEKREIQVKQIQPQLQTYNSYKEKDPLIYEIIILKIQYFRPNSSIGKIYGNISLLTQKIRQALYFELGISESKIEFISEYDQKNDCVVWKEYEVWPKENKEIIDNFLRFLIENKCFIQMPENVDEQFFVYIQQFNINLYIKSLLYFCIANQVPLIEFENGSIFNIKMQSFKDGQDYSKMDPLEILNLPQNMYNYKTKEIKNDYQKVCNTNIRKKKIFQGFQNKVDESYFIKYNVINQDKKKDVEGEQKNQIFLKNTIRFVQED